MGLRAAVLDYLASDEESARTALRDLLADPEAAVDGDSDRIGQTRVYTPPEDADEPDAGPSADAVKNEFCPICGETYAADAGHTNCPNCNAVLDPE
jgi:rubrerythrin